MGSTRLHGFCTWSQVGRMGVDSVRARRKEQTHRSGRARLRGPSWKPEASKRADGHGDSLAA
eukprot:13537901-Heterocapsa_arctica.AAC.1